LNWERNEDIYDVCLLLFLIDLGAIGLEDDSIVFAIGWIAENRKQWYVAFQAPKAHDARGDADVNMRCQKGSGWLEQSTIDRTIGAGIKF